MSEHTAVLDYWAVSRPSEAEATPRMPIRPRRFDQPIGTHNPVYGTKLA